LLLPPGIPNFRAARHDRPRGRFTGGHSSAGRALQWHCRGHRFDPGWLHQFEHGLSWKRLSPFDLRGRNLDAPDGPQVRKAGRLYPRRQRLQSLRHRIPSRHGPQGSLRHAFRSPSLSAAHVVEGGAPSGLAVSRAEPGQPAHGTAAEPACYAAAQMGEIDKRVSLHPLRHERRNSVARAASKGRLK
jgi:hypothetical protein